ncbi:MAG: PQQ-binding-like beta-propeller repeat protein, partial [Candidatus Binataceae bacterium]
MKRVEGQAKFGAVAILAIAAFAILAVGIRTSLHAQLAPSSSSWPIYHHDLSHTGLSPFNTANNSGSLRWKFTAGNAVESSPTIGSDGTIYFGSDDGNLYAVDPYGNLKWNFTTQNSSIVRTAPVIGADGTIYFGVEGGRSYGGIYALNPDGSEKWFSLVEFDVDSSPAIGSDGSI